MRRFFFLFLHCFTSTFLLTLLSLRFEREEMFLSLNLTVKKLDSLHSSLEQLVKGELLEGDNACYCDICRVKGRALVRTCIKAPPQVLTIQLKRFGYDFDNGRSVKYDDHYKVSSTIC